MVSLYAGCEPINDVVSPQPRRPGFKVSNFDIHVFLAFAPPIIL